MDFQQMHESSIQNKLVLLEKVPDRRGSTVHGQREQDHGFALYIGGELAYGASPLQSKTRTKEQVIDMVQNTEPFPRYSTEWRADQLKWLEGPEQYHESVSGLFL